MTNPSTAKFIMAGGGTGGHLFPAIAIADKLKELLRDKMHVEIIFVGTKRGIEYRMKDNLGYPLHLINMRGLVRSFNLKNLMVPFIIIGALIKSASIIKRFQPDLVIGTGGYVCWPVLKSASSKNIPTVLQEQNSFPGITTRQLAGSAKRIYLGFEKAKEFISTESPMIVTGNPVRGSIGRIDKEEALKQLNMNTNKKTILVLGGSQGSRAINQAIVNSIKNKSPNENFQIIWQTGKRGYKDVIKQTGEDVESCTLFPFVKNMSLVYSAADMVIARAGALTLAEIIEFNLPAILIPFPNAAGNHQQKNAEVYVDKKMAKMILENSLSNFDLIGEAQSLLESDEFQIMQDNIENHTADNKRAVDLIAEDIINLLNLN
jgi:UDP-N-acetylglucosamine--N-acetylmuramyl-(pentapeptide) pyrophosphoryl-undecaprenol N-acetylglucosamine transferase